MTEEVTPLAPTKRGRTSGGGKRENRVHIYRWSALPCHVASHQQHVRPPPRLQSAMPRNDQRSRNARKSRRLVLGDGELRYVLLALHLACCWAATCRVRRHVGAPLCALHEAIDTSRVKI